MADEPPVSGEFARELIQATREDAQALEKSAADRQADADARDEKSRRRFQNAVYALGAAVIVLLGGLVVVGAIAVSAGERAAQAETARQQADIRAVAAQLAEPVAQRVLAEGRAESAETARGKLRAANSRLISLKLPVVPEPPANALSAEVQMQGIRAQLLADFGGIDVIADALRRQFGDRGAFPAAFLDQLAPAPGPDGDVTVTVLPDDQPPVPSRQSAPDRPANPRPAPAAPPASRPSPRPAPAPAPAPSRDRGLCLLGVVLCES